MLANTTAQLNGRLFALYDGFHITTLNCAFHGNSDAAFLLYTSHTTVTGKLRRSHGNIHTLPHNAIFSNNSMLFICLHVVIALLSGLLPDFRPVLNPFRLVSHCVNTRLIASF